MPPTWAQVSFNNSDISTISVEEEELYLRARAYHTVSKEIDDALQVAVEASVET
jgi:hypothetical protein